MRKSPYSLAIKITPLLIAVIGGLVWWFFQVSDSADILGLAEPIDTSELGVAGNSSGSQIEKNPPPGGTQTARARQPKLSPQQFLELASNKSVALSALYSYYHDVAYLNDLKKRVTIEPEAAIFLVIESRMQMRPASETIDYLRQAAKAFPKDFLILAFLAGAEAKLGNYATAQEILMTIPDSEGSGSGSAEREASLREVMLASGMDAEWSWTKAARKELQVDFSATAQVLALMNLVNHVGKNGALEEKINFASDLIGVARKLNPESSIIDSRGQVARSLEYGALRILPKDTPYGDDGKTSGQRMAEIEKSQIEDDYVDNEVRPYLYTEKPGVLVKFLQIRAETGNDAALAWAKQQMSLAKK